MKYMLDSNAIIALVMATSDALGRRAAQCDEGDIVTSAVAIAEIAYGSARAKPPAMDQLRAFLEEVPVLDFDYKAAFAYASLPFRRGSYDRLIAAHALANALTIVTNNERDFADIPGLVVENWAL
ncbi:type II toxin-antitoxin system VapC family toxin [Sphingomonas aracearum]|uniref:Ribonuclease VapC n=1 Tax=Sphingomonas aracearum TaxID=2283317 RepID=A0A369VXE8_9SPHN|nr:type II toxin-antitoxin system VapC family toxin [Sphingomonas aracearum]RDE06267.1 type II toxin-antitoxin system VapC family toxin [Sphingomonas aracearum]